MGGLLRWLVPWRRDRYDDSDTDDGDDRGEGERVPGRSEVVGDEEGVFVSVKVILMK